MSAWTMDEKAPLTGDYDDSLRKIRAAMRVPLNEDVVLREMTVLGGRAALCYVDGLASDEKLQRFILEPCMRAVLPEGVKAEDYLENSLLPVGAVKRTARMDTLLNRVFSGDAALIAEGAEGALICDVRGLSTRGVQQPVNEKAVVGPQEGFGESLRGNVSLVRRIMRTPALISEQLSVGSRIPTRLCLLYLDGIAPKETVDEVKRRVAGCNVDYVSSSGMLEQLIEDEPLSLFPQVASTERPDRAASFLLEGQCVLLMENANEALCVPMNILNLYHAPDDTAMRWPYGCFLRVVRLCGALIALLMPALFVALTSFHLEAMSLPLLSSVLEAQSRMPVSVFPGTLMMLLVFNLINEAGTRVPGMMGNTLGIVSALILGQAAVDADLVSPLLIVVVALAGLGSFAVPTYSLSVALRILQLVFTVAAGVAGYFGIAMCLLFALSRLCGLRSLGAPYLAPFAPDRPANPDRILRFPIWRLRLRGYLSDPYHMLRVKGRMRAWEGKEKP